MSKSAKDRLGGVILCGGKSRRMGQSKALLPIHGQTMLQRMVTLVGRSVDFVVVVAAENQELPVLPAEIGIVHDMVADRGPLQGLTTGMHALPSSVEFVYATSTDAPFLVDGWIARLRNAIGEGDLAIVHAQGYHHPLAALYRRSTCLPALEHLLRENRLRPVFLIDAVRSVVLTEDDVRDIDPNLRSLQNLNTPEDYARALDES